MRLLFIIFFLGICITSFAQDSIVINPKPELTGYIKYSSTQRFSFYPFSKSKQVKRVSFHWQKDTSNGRQKRLIYQIPLSNDTIQQSKLDQIFTLNQFETDTLTDILYNECSKWTRIVTTGIMCYLPRNAIIFYDQNNNPFEYIEICFECHGFRTSNTIIETPDKCDLMFSRLKDFFSKHNLKTSVNELMNELNSRKAK